MANIFDVSLYIIKFDRRLTDSDLKTALLQTHAWYHFWTKKDLFHLNDMTLLLPVHPLPWQFFFTEEEKSSVLDPINSLFRNEGETLYEYVNANDYLARGGNPENLTLEEKNRIRKVYAFYHGRYEPTSFLRDESPELPPLNSSSSVIEQLNIDVRIVLSHLHHRLSSLFSILELDKTLRSTFDFTKLKAVSFSDNMRNIEQSLAAFAALFEFCAQLFMSVDNPVVAKAITKVHSALAICFNGAFETIVVKYEHVTRPFFDKDIVLLSQDCFSPGGFQESGWVNDASLREFYRQSLIGYGYSRPPILITFRDEARGMGAYFDHFNIQRITGRKTEISLPPNWSTQIFYDAINKQELKLPQNNDKDTYPAISKNHPDEFGLMIIPGYSNITPEKRPQVHQSRIEHEKAMINHARQTGNPVLAICGGLWTLAEAIGGNLKPSQNHRGSMPELLNTGEIHLGNRPHIHPLFVIPQTKLAQLMGYPQLSAQLYQTKALSVHWQAVAELPKGFKASAFATRAGTEIEAIENEDNHSTIIGIQGHPEAMRENHPGLTEPAQRHHALINNLVAEGDQCHQRRLDNKANEVAKYSYTQIWQQFGIMHASHLTQAEEQENRSGIYEILRGTGLNILDIPGDGNCLFNAVAIYLNVEQQQLRNFCADILIQCRDAYEVLVNALLLPGQTYEDYIAHVRKDAWADDIEITILMRLLNRPIIILKPDGSIAHADAAEQFTDDPVFVLYNGHTHYNALSLSPTIPASEALDQLKRNSYYFSFCKYG